MRINVYHEELTHEAEVVWTEPRPGVRYCGLRVFQKSAPELHHRADDDDRSAITFWSGSLVETQALLIAWLRSVESARQATSEPLALFAPLVTADEDLGKAVEEIARLTARVGELEAQREKLALQFEDVKCALVLESSYQETITTLRAQLAEAERVIGEMRGVLEQAVADYPSRRDSGGRWGGRWGVRGVALLALLVFGLTGCAGWTCGANRERPGVTCSTPGAEVPR